MQLDERDKAILMLLQEDARTPIATIAKRLHLGETTVRYRIERLRRSGVISRFAALLNPRMIGFPVDAIVMLKAEPKLLKSVFETMSRYDEASHILQTTGEYDMVTVVHARSMEHINEIVNKIKSVPGVKETHTWIATGLVKVDPIYRLQ